MRINKKNGMSLAVLMITIIVIIIMVGIVVQSLRDDDSISKASKVAFMSDLQGFKSELEAYNSEQEMFGPREYNFLKLQADEVSITYDGTVDNTKTINNVLPSLVKMVKYQGQLEIVNGVLQYKGLDFVKRGWASEIGVALMELLGPQVQIAAVSNTLVKQGVDIVYTIEFSSDAPISTMNLDGKIEVLDGSEVVLTEQPNIIIGTVSGTESDYVRNVDITIKTDTLSDGTYKLRVKAESVTDANNVSNMMDTIDSLGFIIDNIAPEAPIMLADKTEWTNSDVSVSITYTEDSLTKQYSINGTTWNTYISPVVVSSNNTTVYAKAIDAGGNQSGQSTLTVANIDKIVPIVTATEGGSTASSITIAAVASDLGGSGLNTSSYQYSKDDGATWTEPTNMASYTFGTLTPGIYKCRVKVLDNAMNSAASSTAEISTDISGIIILAADETEWTNADVTVTIIYPEDATSKQYSTDGTVWSDYTGPVIASSNMTVYAKGVDADFEPLDQQSLVVDNIDKILPTVTATNGGTTTSSVTINAAASDLGGSGLNTSSYQYSKDDGATWTTASNMVSYTFNTLPTGTYQCRVKVSDNTGSVSISSAVAINTQSLGTITQAANPTGWTNGNVIVTNTYPAEAVTKQYSTDGTTWNNYIEPVVVSTNNTTVYAKGLDAGSNQIAQTTLTVANIDKVVPIVIATSGGTTTSSITINAAASDTGGSGLNASSYQYSKDDGATWTTATSAVTYTFNTLTTGIYECRVKVLDNATNATISNAVSISTQALGTITQAANPTGWTNGNVTVTNTYPAETVTKQYSTDGTTWNNYTAPIVVSTNNTTVYAKGLDAGSNQIAQTTLTVANIDKIVPTVVYGTNGGSDDSASTTVTVSDTGGSLLNTPTLQYIWDTQNVTTPGSGWTTFTNGATITNGAPGTYYLWVKATDNAGNTLVTKSNSFIVIQFANEPVLAPGMTAKIWNTGTSTWDTITDPVNNKSWYDYENKRWANAQTADGSMWVWLPRYEYKIPTTHSSTAQTIAVNFLIGTPTTPTSTYIVHPAFTFGSTQLTGIWVAKFEASGSTAAIDSKPQVVSVRNTTINNIFTACRNMETNSRYGWGTTGSGIDTHLTKNVEWGAAAYLSQSIYGKNSEVWINPNSGYLTGNAGTSVSSAGSASTYSYDNLTYGVNASTTGNIYGIYDMSGGIYEYTASYMNNGNASLTTYGLSLVNAATQYKDLYTTTGAQQQKGYAPNSSKVGDAMYETSTTYSGSSSWYSDYSELPYSSSPFFTRGGYFSATTSAGTFSFFGFDGSASANVGFRPTLVVNGAL